MNPSTLQPTITMDAFHLASVCDGDVKGATGTIAFRGAAYDSRRVEPDNLFVALTGERTDGHLHLEQAVGSGAGLLMVERGHPTLQNLTTTVTRVEVDNVQRALLHLAGWYRSQFDLPVVAVTGSNGKTTTKEMIAATLASRFDVFKTPGNLNSNIGVPIALFDLNAQHTVAVCELGMSGPGEIDRLGRLVRPHYAVFTNIAPAHLVHLQSVEDVARAKFELLAHLDPDGLAFFCSDDPILRQQAAQLGASSRTFGQSESADVRGLDVRSEESGVRFTMEGGEDVVLPLFGEHNANNALAALAVSRAMGVDTLAAVAALAVMVPAEHRSRITRMGTLTVVDDVYNANPHAVISALQSLSAYPARRRRVAVLGDMLELGAKSADMHREVGSVAAGLGLDELVCVGRETSMLAKEAIASGMPSSHVLHYDDAASCAKALGQWCHPDDTVLLKGSRGVALEKILETMSLQFGDLHKEEI
jgi:UDP-N-acetylmuramoyl-tripeptide--D-alanyl-D-alanine ligase